MKTKKRSSPPPASKPAFSWAVPKELGVATDPLRLRLDFFHQAVMMTSFERDVVETKLVSAMDVAHALANELSFGSGLLPEGALWWNNTKEGPLVALYVEPKAWKVALQVDVAKPPRRFKIPLPGMIFMCSSGRPPWVYAVKAKPTKEADPVFKAPLCNVFANGRSCPGSHKYPADVRETVTSFFISFFSAAGDLQGRSRKFPKSVVELWAHLDKKAEFPVEDLVPHGTIADLLRMEVRG